MSTIWTPGGERPVGRQPAPEPDQADLGAEELSDEELQERMEQLREQLANTPAELVVANHCYGLFELAALHLSLQPPQLEQAKIAIDALGGVMEAVGDRMGEQQQQIADAVAQLRLAYVQIQGAAAGDPPSAT